MTKPLNVERRVNAGKAEEAKDKKERSEKGGTCDKNHREPIRESIPVALKEIKEDLGEGEIYSLSHNYVYKTDHGSPKERLARCRNRKGAGKKKKGPISIKHCKSKGCHRCLPRRRIS